ncbi:MAG: hypothetical protein HWN67_15990 [Candidatus Helarchaeota archaeon]|nr:hypothetical protein [Candidatus Helarchaeota archaeon]
MFCVIDTNFLISLHSLSDLRALINLNSANFLIPKAVMNELRGNTKEDVENFINANSSRISLEIVTTGDLQNFINNLEMNIDSSPQVFLELKDEFDSIACVKLSNHCPDVICHKGAIRSLSNVVSDGNIAMVIRKEAGNIVLEFGDANVCSLVLKYDSNLLSEDMDIWYILELLNFDKKKLMLLSTLFGVVYKDDPIAFMNSLINLFESETIVLSKDFLSRTYTRVYINRLLTNIEDVISSFSSKIMDKIDIDIELVKKAHILKKQSRKMIDDFLDIDTWEFDIDTFLVELKDILKIIGALDSEFRALS